MRDWVWKVRLWWLWGFVNAGGWKFVGEPGMLMCDLDEVIGSLMLQWFCWGRVGIWKAFSRWGWWAQYQVGFDCELMMKGAVINYSDGGAMLESLGMDVVNWSGIDGVWDDDEGIEMANLAYRKVWWLWFSCADGFDVALMMVVLCIRSGAQSIYGIDVRLCRWWWMKKIV